MIAIRILPDPTVRYFKKIDPAWDFILNELGLAERNLPRPGGKEELQAFVNDLNKIQFKVVVL